MHAAPEGLLEAHSIAEAYLFVSLAYCPLCRRRPLQVVNQLRVDPATPFQWLLQVNCRGCGENSTLKFFMVVPEKSERSRINPTEDRSRIIDPAGWLALFRTILDGAANESKPEDARQMTLEAVECLDEALRFYEPGNEYPSESCFHTQASRTRAREHPEQFAKSKLLAMKNKLPVVSSSGPTRAVARRKWWQFWRR